MKRVYLFLGLFLVGYKPVTAQYGSCTTIDYIKAQYYSGYGGHGFGSAGTAISGDGNTMAVGTIIENGSGMGVNPNPALAGTATNSGAVFVYTRTDSLSPWVFQAYIKASNTQADDYFGNSVSLSSDGSTLAVGAVFEDGSGKGVNPTPMEGASNAGAVYIYTRSGSTWSFSAYIKASNTAALDRFGFSVSLSGDGNTLAVGANYEDGSATDAGAVYIYTRSASTWRFRNYIKAKDTRSSDYFGVSVSLSYDGNSLAVGANGEYGSGTGVNPTDDNNGLYQYSGAVYTYNRIYTPTDTVWRFRAYIKASNTGTRDDNNSSDYFGAAVSLSRDGTTLAVGASGEDGIGTGIGTTSNEDAADAGAVYIYGYNPIDSTWSAGPYIKASNSGSLDYFGCSVSLSSDGNTLAVGANGEDGSGTGINPANNNSSLGSGAAYLFKRTAGTWVQNAYIKAPVTTADDYFGAAVSLSANGTNLVVGAFGDRGTNNGVNPVKNDPNTGNAYGAVWVYNQYGATLPQLTTNGTVTNANVCTDPLYFNLKDPNDKTGRRNIARIFKNGNSFTVDNATVDASTTGTYLATAGTQSTKLMSRMLSITTTPASGLTVNGGPIVRLYYDTTEKKAQLPVGTYNNQNWFKHAGNKASTLADLTAITLNNSTNLTPVASGFEDNRAYVDLKVNSFGTFGAVASTYTPPPPQYDACTTIDYIQAQYLSTGDFYEGFGGKGMAISGDGNTMAVGDINEARSGTLVNPALAGSASDWAKSGAVFVYTRTDSLSPWVFQAYIKASNTGAGDQFGSSVSLSYDGSTLAVGANLEDGSGTGINHTPNVGARNAGAVYMYTRSGSTWSYKDYIKASNTAGNDRFGFSVSLSGDGNTLAVGARYQSNQEGAVYIYTRSGSTWRFRDYIKANNAEADDYFGVSVSLSYDGNNLAVGATGEDGSGTGINPDSNEDAVSSGAVYTYNRRIYTLTADTVWRFRAYIKASNTTADDNFGNSISLSGDGTTLAVGCSSSDGGAGAVDIYTYTPSDSTWHSSTYIQASNKEASDAFGTVVSLSGDGNTLAVGAWAEDGSGTGINPDNNNGSPDNGAAYLFKRHLGVWIQNGYIKAPINAGGDYFGTAIGLSANGANLLVGAGYDQSSGTGVNPVKNNINKDVYGTKYGAVWVYNQYGVTAPKLTTDGIVSKANVCADPLYINLKDTSDKSGRKNIARIFKNGNSFTVDNAFVDASSAGTYLASIAGVQSTKLLRRMFTITTTPASGLTVNGGPIVRLYYDTTEKKAQLPVDTYPTQNWFQHAGNKASTLADLIPTSLNNSTNLTPVASGFEDKQAYVDFQVANFGTFGILGSTWALLPVSLHQFDAKANANCGVDISWTTANEKNINRFVVQGSTNGSDWQDKGVVKPSNSSSTLQEYQYQDVLGQSGTYYYRLMYEENDGKKTYSPAVALRMNCAANSPKAFPTITQDRVNIWLPESYANAQIMVFNLVGQRQNIEQTSNGSYRVLRLNALAQGSYIVRIVQKDGNAVHLKVIKQ